MQQDTILIQINNAYLSLHDVLELILLVVANNVKIITFWLMGDAISVLILRDVNPTLMVDVQYAKLVILF